ncbi:MAG: response regulator [Deltaproteobacteria bacterium]
MISLKLALRQNVESLKEVLDALFLIRRSSETGNFSKKDAVVELERTLGMMSKKLHSMKKSGEEEYHLAAAMVENLVQNAKSLIMFPFSFLTEGFQKLVREIAREQGKEVKLYLNGETTELDRRILQELKDPLVHMVRNCVDHGIEIPKERLAVGKSAHARIQVGISVIENGKATVTVQDDGRGIDTETIIKAAVNRGIISREKAATINENEAIQLIFHSGLSSRHEVSEISGRGLGLAIVQERIESLGGTVSVRSFMGQGTSFTMIIPLTLATFRGIQISVGQRLFAIPTLNVQRVCRLPESEFKSVGNRETIVLGGRTIPVAPLAGILGIPAARSPATGFRNLMILGTGEEQVAFELDEVIGEDDLLVKRLGPQLSRVRNVSGATVLGNGMVVPIINANDLLASAGGGHVVIHSEKPVSEASGLTTRTAKRIIVVDDSITSRTLLKNVLESYGYEVQTACDGLDALAILQGGDLFDLATIDIEMPRMDGFELTARLRADDRFSRLPVVLITSLDSSEDKKKGIDAGADAYIVKSSFDQSNLLDIIRKLT